MTKRITVASNRIATPRPTPIIFISSIDKVAKIEKTATITAAALVTTPAVSLIPWRTASRAGRPEAAYSRTRLKTKT